MDRLHRRTIPQTADKEGKDLNRWDQQSMFWCGDIMRWYLSSRAVVGSAIVFSSSLNVWVWTTKIYVRTVFWWIQTFSFLLLAFTTATDSWISNLRKERNTLWSQSKRPKRETRSVGIEGNKKSKIIVHMLKQGERPVRPDRKTVSGRSEVHSGIAWAWCIGEVRGKYWEKNMKGRNVSLRHLFCILPFFLSIVLGTIVVNELMEVML